MIKLRRYTAAALTSLIFGCVVEAKIDTKVSEEAKPPEEPMVQEEVQPRMVCVGCSPAEQIAVDFFFERGITEPRAMSVVLGNIKQESNFHANICEGGARIPYENCHRGGYGLIQWTTTGRYDGLGRFAKNHGGSPSDLGTQLRYLVTERQWLTIEPTLVKGGASTQHYMRGAYRWLGWGIYGNRGHFSEQYLSKLRVIS